MHACKQTLAADLWGVVGHQLVQICRLEGAQVQLPAGQGAGLRSGGTHTSGMQVGP